MNVLKLLYVAPVTLISGGKPRYVVAEIVVVLTDVALTDVALTVEAVNAVAVIVLVVIAVVVILVAVMLPKLFKLLTVNDVPPVLLVNVIVPLE